MLDWQYPGRAYGEPLDIANGTLLQKQLRLLPQYSLVLLYYLVLVHTKCRMLKAARSNLNFFESHRRGAVPLFSGGEVHHGACAQHRYRAGNSFYSP